MQTAKIAPGAERNDSRNKVGWTIATDLILVETSLPVR